MRRAITLSAAIAFTVVLTASASIDNDIHRTFNAGNGGTLTVDGAVGQVRVTTGGSSVTVDVYREARTNNRSEADATFRENDVTFEQSGNDVIVHGPRRHDRGWFDWNSHLRIRYEIRVPSHYNLALRTSGGSIEVIGDLDGNADCRTSGGSVKLSGVRQAEVHTSGGSIRIGDAAGTVSAHTSGGSISIASSSGQVTAKTSGGSIEIGRAGGPIVARTSGGGIRIGEVLDSVDAETSGGSISARIGRQPRSDSRLSTSGGHVTVELARSIGVELDAHASGGSVHSDVPITFVGTMGDSHELKGRVNGGGPALTVSASGGGVTVRSF